MLCDMCTDGGEHDAGTLWEVQKGSVLPAGATCLSGFGLAEAQEDLQETLGYPVCAIHSDYLPLTNLVFMSLRPREVL